MTTQRDAHSTKWRYSLAADRFVLPRLSSGVDVSSRVDVAPWHTQQRQPLSQHLPQRLWRQLTRLWLTENAPKTSQHSHEKQTEKRKEQRKEQRKRTALATRTRHAISGHREHANGKGYSGAVLATTAIFKHRPHLPYDDYLGKPLVEHTLSSLEHAFERFVIADEDARLTAPRYPELIPSGRALSGLHSALSFAFQDWVAVVAYDLPHVSSYYWDYLFARRGGAPIVIAQDASGEFMPVAALYHRSVIMQVAHLLENNQGDLEELLSVCGATVIPWESLEVRFGRQLFTPAVAVSQPPM